jgi:phosphate acetyltransferase
MGGPGHRPSRQRTCVMTPKQYADIEAGNMLAKNLVYPAKADSAGIVLGARVPIILTSRADSVRSRLASCPAAVLYADARRKGAALPAA